MEPSLARIWSNFRRFVGVPTRQGEWRTGSAFSALGILAVAPLVVPRRQYLVYLPRGHTRWRRAPLIVLCHGCRQTPEAFAQGTRIAAAADANRWLVVMPRQRDNANAWSCWNWFDSATVAGTGEAAIVAAITRKVVRRHGADASRVFAAGLSAGGALAAILGVRFPALFRGVAVHSGIACGAAMTPLSAASVMARGPETNVAAIGRAAHDPAHRVPLLVLQGMADDVMAPRNATALARQYLALAGVAVDAGTLPGPSGDRSDQTSGRRVRTRDWRDNAGLVARLVEIDGLGHAWSGGDASLPYNDGAAPDALATIRDWIRDLAP
ncbi:MAG: PHB depolymerase family esterase [Betaproteobacteria bacterium]